jgi:ABC-type nickel/cobalt efflux system permease component RcnA
VTFLKVTFNEVTLQRFCAIARRAPQFWLVAALVLLAPSTVWAASTGPFGVGLPEGGSMPGAAFFPRLFNLFISVQVYFNQHMTTAVRAMRHDSHAAWTLLGLSFLYGVVHAAGPGHGKAVVSSYLLATRQSLRNGIVLAFVASLAQAGGAIALILVASMVLHMTSVSMTWASFYFEIVSDALVVTLGCWLIWSKIIRPAWTPKLNFEPVNFLTRPERYLAGAAPAGASRFQALDAAEPSMVSNPRLRVQTNGPMTPFNHIDLGACECGHTHMPDAAVLDGSLDWRKAWTVVASTALRPCTGALIVLVFSISQGLLLAGITATLVMGLGTAITVSGLAVLAVSARKTAFILTGADSPLGRRLMRGMEACGAIAVLLFGVLLLVGTLVLQ